MPSIAFTHPPPQHLWGLLVLPALCKCGLQVAALCQGLGEAPGVQGVNPDAPSASGTYGPPKREHGSGEHTCGSDAVTTAQRCGQALCCPRAQGSDPLLRLKTQSPDTRDGFCKGPRTCSSVMVVTGRSLKCRLRRPHRSQGGGDWWGQVGGRRGLAGKCQQVTSHLGKAEPGGRRGLALLLRLRAQPSSRLWCPRRVSAGLGQLVCGARGSHVWSRLFCVPYSPLPRSWPTGIPAGSFCLSLHPI